jgi:hypothetical protein
VMWKPSLRSRGLITAATIFAFVSSQLIAQQTDTSSTKPVFVTSGQEITPTAAPSSTLTYLNPGLSDFPNYIASGGITTTISPDGNTLLVLTAGYNNLDVEDHLGNVEKFNRIVWEGLKGSLPYPEQRSGADLRQNRQQLLLRTAAAANAGS